MLQRLIIFILIMCGVLTHSFADVDFSIRYHNKNIYYPGDVIELKLTLVNNAPMGSPEETFFLADDLRQSFGFNVNALSGEIADSTEGYITAINNPGAYRVVHLAPGQALSFVVPLNNWVEIFQAEQYILRGFFYSRLRGTNTAVSQSDTVLDLTILPETDDRWMNELEESIRNALISRNLDPLGVVREIIESHFSAKYNRALIYLDLESLSRNLPSIPNAAILKKNLLKGLWRSIPGMDLPVTSLEPLFSQVYKEEAIIQAIAVYAGFGEQFSRNLRFYLHNRNGYWAVRHVETFPDNAQMNALREFGSPIVNPPEVVAALIHAAGRGDWDIVFRYYSIEDIVRNLPEHKIRWKNMSSTDHEIAITHYRDKVITGDMDSAILPLTDLEDWKISSVNYTQLSGRIVIDNSKTYDTLAGEIRQRTQYTFRLERLGGINGKWIVTRYDTVRIQD